jgi:hypothetical protein
MAALRAGSVFFFPNVMIYESALVSDIQQDDSSYLLGHPRCFFRLW